MKSLIIFDSNFGNTKRLAEAVARTFGKNSMAVNVNDVTDAMIDAADTIVIGSPINIWMPSFKTMSLLWKIGKNRLQGKRVAAFDTRYSRQTAGNAAGLIAESLVKRGGTLAAPPQRFYVVDMIGPLKDGELSRAESWAKGMLQEA